MTPDHSKYEPEGGSPDRPVDLLVIGGGINGAGVARDAAGRGLSVILCEKGDLGEGTSSRSGKYIHGGLRYLEYYEFRLVREALNEREVVLEAAPHLSWPLRLVLPHSPEQRPRWLIRLGLFLYDNLGGRKRVPGSSAIDLRKDLAGEQLKARFTKGFSYWDVWIDDARLVALNAVDAFRRGAQVLTRTACVSARRQGNVWRAELKGDGKPTTVYAKAVVNAAGPWVEKVLGEVAGVNSRMSVRLVKGSHLVMPKWWQGDHGYVLQAPDKRLIFVNPYFDDMALIGTTDIPFEGRAEDVAIEASEVDYLLEILRSYFEHEFKSEDVLFNYSGVRPLFDDDANKSASAVTRDYQFELDGSLEPGSDQPPLLSAFGGKLTTYRKLSEQALQMLSPYFPEMGDAWTADTPLPGGDLPDKNFDAWFTGLKRRFAYLPEALVLHLARCYGTDVVRLLDGVNDICDMGEHFGGVFFEKEADWLLREEWAVSSEDFLLRRTKHGLFLTPAEKSGFENWLERRQAVHEPVS
ncbi:glycerol-3-phosphate dehydrogenase [Labrenzia sp. THAF82]|uniref:glycerol-3-phosphate dehydrogenase n=1 Tax=Labrenzia sp. THAF82 TaxID=2587861 RepID=UPI00126831DE|nr:glycerol-3-phosphate dehydrogenase [Labrenzia sp. THAF82]